MKTLAAVFAVLSAFATTSAHAQDAAVTSKALLCVDADGLELDVNDQSTYYSQPVFLRSETDSPILGNLVDRQGRTTTGETLDLEFSRNCGVNADAPVVMSCTSSSWIIARTQYQYEQGQSDITVANRLTQTSDTHVTVTKTSAGIHVSLKVGDSQSGGSISIERDFALSDEIPNQYRPGCTFNVPTHD